MTYLELCQRVHLLTRIGSRGNTAKPGTVPTAVTGQVDELAEIVAWVRDEWIAFQLERQWGFLQTTGTLVFPASTTTVTPTATLTTYAEWMPFIEGLQIGRRYALCYLTSAGQTAEQKIYFEPYEDFRGYRDRAVVATGRPQYFTMAPNRDWIVYPTPDDSYTIRFDYLVAPQIFSANSDDPKNYPTSNKGLPAEHHEVIAWRAVKRYAETRSDGALLVTAERRIRQQSLPIYNRFLPSPRLW